MKQYKHGELSKEILKGFLIGGLVISCVILPGMAPILKMVNAATSRERERTRRAVHRLERKGALVRERRRDGEYFSVSKKGEKRLKDYLLDDLTIPEVKRWDGVWRVVSFDIPEKKGNIRREVSFKIKDMGMIAVHNSVFISPYPCKNELDFLLDFYSVRQYFLYFETKTLEPEEAARKHFTIH